MSEQHGGVCALLMRMEMQQVSTTERRVTPDRRRRYSDVDAAGQERRRAPRRVVAARAVRLSLDAVRRAAETVAQELDARLTVLGILKAGSSYVEILLEIQDCDAEPCRWTVRMDRHVPVDGARSVVQKAIEAQLRRRITH